MLTGSCFIEVPIKFGGKAKYFVEYVEFIEESFIY